MGNFRVPGGTYGTLMAGQSIYEESSTPCTAVGTRLPMGDRVFFYAKASATCAAGQVLAPDATVAGPSLMADGSCVAIASPTLGDKKAITAALAVGDRGIGITHASSLDNIVAHDLQNGYIVLTDSAGADQCYKIKDNTVMASDIVEILLYDEIRTVTADATTGLTITSNPFMNVRPATLQTDEAPCGVPLIAITDNYYFWAQSWGIGPMLIITGTTAIGGESLMLTTTAGAADIVTGANSSRVGLGLADITANTDAGMALIQLYP